jgi:hypothetical protein
MPDHEDVQAHPSIVSTEAVQRILRELVSNLTPDIFSRLEGPQMEFNIKLQSHLKVVLETVEKHFRDQEHLNAAKAVPRTVAVHQLNLTNAQLTGTWGCAREITHSLSPLLIQLERVMDTLQTPSPILVSPPLNYDISSHYVLPFKRLKTRFPNDLPSVTLDVQRLTQENLLAHQKLLEVQNVSDRTKQALLDATTALNLIQGQAISEDGKYGIPKVIY